MKINSNEPNNNEPTNDNGPSNPPISYQSRGSITSGMPVVSNGQSTSSSYATCVSSEDEESGVSSCNAMKYQRKTRSRHEPYLASSEKSSAPVQAGALSQTSPNYRSRQREQSFSGTNSPTQHMLDRYNGKSQRRSEPNALDLIYAHRAHLEKIYNQSINKSNLSPTQELIILQQENPCIDEKTQMQWQKQHNNLKFNLVRIFFYF